MVIEETNSSIKVKKEEKERKIFVNDSVKVTIWSVPETGVSFEE